ncbi:dipeptidyl peptidase III [Aspergillus pseudoustus]|uniref:Dipeptidyl peptidase 3 n=1 Tax=Aspergillus pseudoustus TaxID=1810923 RepID=A0ABR4JD78_9EURO
MAAPVIFQLCVASAFNGLAKQEKLYAHWMAKAAWRGTRIILRQVSPEANGIFDLIIALYRSCKGDWEQLAATANVSPEELQQFLDYAALFLSNIGNYFGSGDQKFVPEISKEALTRLASGHHRAKKLLDHVLEDMYQQPPLSLGPHGPLTQTSYYLGDDCLDSPEEISSIATLMENLSTHPENTRLQRYQTAGVDCYDILQASVDESTVVLNSTSIPSLDNKQLRLVRGDHKDELEQICKCLRRASKYTSNPAQQQVLQQTMDSFLLGDLELYREAQMIWVTDKAPPVETVLGFVETYRDPLGVRAEFEGIVGVPEPSETELLEKLASVAEAFVYKLPWVTGGITSIEKGPFEKNIFDPPGFSSVQSLAYCSSNIFPGINLPNYNDIRQEIGYKNILFSNRMLAERIRTRGLHLVAEQEQEKYQNNRFHSYYIWVVLHEILGHGTGKFLAEVSEDNYNFDPVNPPLNPLTGLSVDCWYRAGQTWTGVFGDLATTVDECRAELVGAYLFDERDILALFGYTENSVVKPEDCNFVRLQRLCIHADVLCSVIYNMYLQLGVDGIRGLANYDPITKKWGQAHSRAHYTIFRHLLRDSDGLYTVQCEPHANRLTVEVDRGNILRKGKPSLGRMLLMLHIYRCTADVSKCREFYEDLSQVSEEALRWRNVVLYHKEPPLAFCHANTFLFHDHVELREYESTAKGLIQSWADRELL